MALAARRRLTRLARTGGTVEASVAKLAPPIYPRAQFVNEGHQCGDGVNAAVMGATESATVAEQVADHARECDA